MQIFKEKRNNNAYVGLVDRVPSYAIHKPGQGTEWASLEKTDRCAGCLHCINPRCMNYDVERVSSEIQEFVPDNSTIVCPVNAMLWDKEKCMPVIDHEKCIMCGLCARECPAGAIYYKDYRWHISESEEVILVEATEENTKHHVEMMEKYLNVYKTGYMVKESNDVLNKIYEKVQKLGGNTPNLFARNMLVSLGNKCAIGRVGDVYTRVDALLKTNSGDIAVTEVEFGRDTLEAARGILDDIAVANCRYGLSKKSILSLVVCLQLPNERQGYWQVIKDVKKVERLSIDIVTLGCLLVLLWNLQKFDISENSFYADYDNMTIRRNAEYILDGEVNISNRYLGILEPEK